MSNSLDSLRHNPNILAMTDNLPTTIPSLARAFQNEREDLRALITGEDLSSQRAVSEARRALDRTGDIFARATDDIQIQKAGLWLLEMVKSGAGVLDRGAKADVVWREVPPTSPRVIAGSTLFYGAALFFGLAGILQGSRLTILAAMVMAALRFFDPKDWKNLLGKIPFIGRNKQKLLEAPDGNRFLADAHVSVEAAGYVDALAEALHTADHVLLRLAEPVLETTWTDDARLMSFVQGLLEARSVDDGHFALKLVGSELESILNADGIEVVNYSRKTAKLFDVLPALDLEDGKTKQAAPTLMLGDKVLRRGTVWQA